MAFRRLDEGVAEQKFDLLQVAAVLATEFRAGAAQVLGAETLDTDGFGGSLDRAPDCPIAQFLSHNTPFGVILGLDHKLYSI